MSNKSLSKYSRVELLNLLYNQQKKIEELEAENEDLKQQIEEKKIRIDDCDSIAEASLKLTDIFKQAQEAADMYLQNVKAVAQDGEKIKTAPVKQNPQPVKQKASSAPVNNVRPQVQPKQQPQPRPQAQVQPRTQVQQQVQPRVQVQPQAQPRVQTQPRVQPQVQVQPRVQAPTQVQQPQVQYRQVVADKKPKPSVKPMINARPMVRVLPDEEVIDYSDYETMMNDSPIILDSVVKAQPQRQVYNRTANETELPKRAKRSNNVSRQQSRQTIAVNTKQKDLVKEMEMDILGQFDRVTKSDSSEQYSRSRHAKRRRSQ